MAIVIAHKLVANYFQRRLDAIEALLKIISKYFTWAISFNTKSVLKGSQGLTTYLESVMHRLSGDINFIAIHALFWLKFLNHAHYQLAHTGLSYSNNSLNYDYLAIQYLHNAFNSQKITGTMKIFLMALQSRPTSSELLLWLVSSTMMMVPAENLASAILLINDGKHAWKTVPSAYLQL